MHFIIVNCIGAATAAILPVGMRHEPVVRLATAVLTGKSDGEVDTFSNIPFAEPPVGPLRRRTPQPLGRILGNYKATGSAKACPQSFKSSKFRTATSGTLQTVINMPIFQKVANYDEDCLTINVQRPAGLAPDAKLPVFFWIYGGAFTAGSTSGYDATPMIRASKTLGPVLFVAANYRVGGFGFLPGKEVQDSGNGNIGLLDQRLALQWVADNIANFGGDPDKVTIGGESAGAISVFDQMILYNGNHLYKGRPLFRAAIMNSGSVIPADPLDCPKGQAVYDQVVREAGCAGKPDTLACLRSIDFRTFNRAATSPPGMFDYSSVALSYMPRPDGKVLTASPLSLSAERRFPAINLLLNSVEDEGSLFSIFQQNLSTTADVVGYLQTYFFPHADRALTKALVDTYPDDPTLGSPFRAQVRRPPYPQYKRMAAILGDIVFTLVRREVLEMVSPKVRAWSSLGSYGHGTPLLGTFHGSDIMALFFKAGFPQTQMFTYYLNFIRHLDPNVGTPTTLFWPEWKIGKQMLNIEAKSSKLITDTFREDSAAVLRKAGALFNV